MRIAYIALGLELEERRGVLNKLVGQIRQWRAAGCEPRLFVQAHRAPASDDSAVDLFNGDLEVFTSGRIRGRASVLGLRERFGVVESLARRVVEWGAELCYIRFNTSYPALARLAQRVPSILEINTDDLREYRLVLSRPRYLYHRVARAGLFRRARGFIFVTRELETAASFARWRKPSTVIANGIDLSSYPAHPAVPKPRPRLVFIGSPGHPWHGLDKVLALARACPDWDFDIVGPSRAQGAEPVSANVRFHGYLRREDYDAILARADIGLGTLALHGNGMNEACPLKVREYLAYGLPTIIGYRDTDFPDGSEYLLELPNTPDNVACNVDTIRDFVRRMVGVRVPRTAIAHLDVARKEQMRLAFFDRLRQGGQERIGADGDLGGYGADGGARSRATPGACRADGTGENAATRQASR